MNKSHPHRRLLPPVLTFCALLAACVTIEKAPPTCPPQPPPCPPCAAVPTLPETTPAAPPAQPLQAARWSDLPGWNNDDLPAAWPAFLQSCRGLAGTSRWPAWRAVCEQARVVADTDTPAIRDFFESRFAPYLLTNPDGSTQGLVTGYYEPLLRGSRTRTEKYSQPVLGVPPDLLTIDLSDVLPDLKNMRLRGRLVGDRVLPYFSRAEIAEQGLADLHPEKVLLWIDDAVELFFLQIQGSGRVKLADGSVVRLGYANQNGHPYKAIGRVLAERGELPIEQASMQGIQAWARANPSRLAELLDANPSYVFFRETPVRGNGDKDGGDDAEGPQGALGVPLTPGRSIAVDPRHVPLGAPVFLSTTEPLSKVPLTRLVLAQDTGGAIRGVARADFFWGFGADAGVRAGRMKQSGAMWVLLPVDSGAASP
ncbi:MAG: murein transglycosylase A [Candidatus Accumulibacter sp.]|jgi:membrane-bound lytic murein transglycosylase A|nr:murein transglycosylase A [Accumulibacter sp.]